MGAGYGSRPFSLGAASSAVERLVYTERVGGSIPSPPTIAKRLMLGLLKRTTGSQQAADASVAFAVPEMIARVRT